MKELKPFFTDLTESNLSRFENIITKPTIIIAITARTGSTALCSALSKLNILGKIEEYLNPRGPIQHFANDCNNLFSNYLNKLDQTYSGNYLVFKSSWNDFKPFAKNKEFKKIFANPIFIYLDRFDLNAQAISLLISKKTGTWHIKKNEEWKESDKINEKLNIREAFKIRAALENEKMHWHSFFYDNDINYLHLHYEFFTQNINDAVRKINNYVGIEIDDEQINKANSDYIKVDKPLYKTWLKELDKVVYKS